VLHSHLEVPAAVMRGFDEWFEVAGDLKGGGIWVLNSHLEVPALIMQGLMMGGLSRRPQILMGSESMACCSDS
jgi:hypothetical protein